MGGGRFTPDDWKGYTDTRTATSPTGTSYDDMKASEIHRVKSLDKDLDPRNIKVRESRDSDLNPKSNAIIIAEDVTGSMAAVLESIAKKGLPTLFKEIYDRKPVVDPHILLMGIGDMECDRAPVQATQFEADIRLAEQLEKIFFEQGGGGNSYESYAAAWYFAATRTSIDCFEKRKKKGYLFTVGDEEPTPVLRREGLEQFFGDKLQADMSMNEVLTLASRQWEIFHVVVEEGSHARHSRDRVLKNWAEVLGQRVLPLADHTKLAEVIVSAIQVNEGADADKVADSWDGTTAIVVRKATESLSRGATADGGLVTL